jgi:hypothetical protein
LSVVALTLQLVAMIALVVKFIAIGLDVMAVHPKAVP